MKPWVGLLLGVALVPSLTQAAESEEPRHFGAQRTFGFGPTVGWYAGLGVVAEFKPGPLGVVVGGGFQPLLLLGETTANRAEDLFGAEHGDTTYDYFNTGQLSADVLVGPIWKTHKVDVDFMGGYRWNSLLGHGVGLGVRIAVDLSRVLRLEIHGAPSFYPGAKSRVRDALEREQDDLPARRLVGPWLQPGIGVALVVYP